MPLLSSFRDAPDDVERNWSTSIVETNDRVVLSRVNSGDYYGE